MRGAVLAKLPPAVEEVPALIPYDVGARSALELTVTEAVRLGHDYVDTEHILLALLELGETSLTGLGIDKPTAETHIAAPADAPSAQACSN